MQIDCVHCCTVSKNLIIFNVFEVLIAPPSQKHEFSGIIICSCLLPSLDFLWKLILWTWSLRMTLLDTPRKNSDKRERKSSIRGQLLIHHPLCTNVLLSTDVCICTENLNVCVLSFCLQLCCICSSWQRKPWCCSSSVSCCGPAILLFSSLSLISKTQSDSSVPAPSRPPGFLLCIAGGATKSGLMQTGRLLASYIQYVYGAWFMSSSIQWPLERLLLD